MVPPNPPPFWMRHTASVPKGFIRYRVLQLLGQQAMSGSEIMETIEKETSGQWKPSPGSIYPLLTWLKENNHVEDVHSDNPHLKRYQLTESGKKLAKRQAPFTEKFQGGPGLFPSSFSLGPRISGAVQDKFRTVFQQIFKGLFDLRLTMGDDPPPAQIQGFTKILRKIYKQIDHFHQSIKTENTASSESD